MLMRATMRPIAHHLNRLVDGCLLGSGTGYVYLRVNVWVKRMGWGVSSPLLQISHRHRLAAFAPPFDFTLARRQLLWQWQCIILFPATSTVLRDH